MHSSTLSASPSLAVHFATTTKAISLSSFLSDRVPEDADALYLELDDVSLAQVAIRLDACSARGRPRAEDLARIDRLRLRGVGDHVRELVAHVPRVILAPLLTVDADAHVEVVRVDLVGGYDARTQDVGAIPVLRLRRAHSHRKLPRLRVAGRKVVPDGVAEDVPVSLLARDVLSPAPDYGGELQLVVEHLRVERVGDRLVG